MDCLSILRKLQYMKPIENYFVSPNSSLRDVIYVIDRGAAQIALVVDGNHRLIGTLTDGDIRRAMLRNESLQTPAMSVMSKNFRFLASSATDQDAIALMRRDKLHQIPIVDDQGRVQRLLLLEDLVKPKTNTNLVVIMAGGEGRRLRPLTNDCPKPMLIVGGKPLLEIILQHCIDAGFKDYYLAVNYLKKQVKDYFGNGLSWSVNIKYLEENQPLGTGGSLSLLPRITSEPILVMNADVLTKIDFEGLLRFHEENAADATLCVREHTTQIPFGVVRMDNLRLLEIEEKPVLSHYVNAGIYLLNPDLLDLVPADSFIDMPQLLEKAIERQLRVCTFPVHEYWLDVGSTANLEKAKDDWK